MGVALKLVATFEYTGQTAAIVMEQLVVAVPPIESTTFREKLYVPADVGVPVIAPVLGSILYAETSFELKLTA